MGLHCLTKNNGISYSFTTNFGPIAFRILSQIIQLLTQLWWHAVAGKRLSIKFLRLAAAGKGNGVAHYVNVNC